MAPPSIYVLHIIILHAFVLLFPNQINFDELGFVNASTDDLSDYNSLFHGDYSPLSPPSLPPHPPSLSCEADLKGTESLNTVCELDYNLNFTGDVYLQGNGSLIVRPGVILSCPINGCSIAINISGEVRLGAQIIAGSVYVVAGNVSLFEWSVINVTASALQSSLLC